MGSGEKDGVGRAFSAAGDDPSLVWWCYQEGGSLALGGVTAHETRESRWNHCCCYRWGGCFGRGTDEFEGGERRVAGVV